MKMFFNLTIRSWIMLFLIVSNADVINGQDAFALNYSLLGNVQNMWSRILSILRRPRPRPRPAPIRAPVKVPVKVPSPVVTPKAVPVQISQPKVVPIQVPKVAPVPIPRPVPRPVSIPKAAPVSIPVRIPMKVLTVTPIRAPFVVPSFTPKNIPVKPPSPIPISAPLPRPPIPTPIINPMASPPKTSPIITPLSVAPQITILYTHGDAPYAADQAIRLEAQMKSVPKDAEFIVFVGDLRKAGNAITCRVEEYETVAGLFRLSPVPVFVLIGDNDANDCPNIAEGQKYWNDNFLNFESRYWNHTFAIRRQDGYPDNFAFTHKKSLFIGLNIIGGLTRDMTEWEVRLSSEAMWTISMIRDYLNILRQMGPNNVGRIVIFGHADPGGRHAPFFQPIATFIDNELKNQVPILYVNGDKHEWTYTPSFYGKSSWLRVGVEGLATDPLLKVTIDGNGNTIDPVQAFVIDRRL